nr:MAG TPA: hypothetical protein [Caudoviricetes sp.]
MRSAPYIFLYCTVQFARSQHIFTCKMHII